MTPPQLYVFAISHYCEKARRALDYLGIEHEIKYLAPGCMLNG
jgi:glutathione S-transferase